MKRQGPSRHVGQKLHILLVENSPFQQIGIAQMLKQLGYAVNVTDDGVRTQACTAPRIEADS